MQRDSLAILILAMGGHCLGAVSTNVPLDHWSYGAIEKLADYGLIDSAMPGTKPFSRIEMARMIDAAHTHALEQGREGPIVQALLDRLTEEFSHEMNRTGAYAWAVRQDFIKPIEDPYVRLVYGADPFDLENQAGDLFEEGVNTRIGFASRINLFDRFAAYLHPEFEDPSTTDSGIELIEGYGKAQVGDWEVEAGKDSMWWGPGHHGSMLMGNNAKNLTLLKVSNPQPIQLPWVLGHLGPFKGVFFLSQLEEGRQDAPKAKFTGVRLSSKPFPWLEIGGSRTIQFGGDGMPDIGVDDYLQVFWPKNLQGTENQLAALDASMWMPLPTWVPARSLKAYVEYAGEDAAGFRTYRPLLGLQLNDLLRTGRTDLRVEYAETSDLFYVHSIYTDGYTYDDRVMGHHMGTNAEDLFLRVTHYLSADLVLGVDADRQQYGSGGAVQPTIYQVGVDLVWFGPRNWQVRAAYRYQEVDDDAGLEDENHVIDLRVVYRF